MLFLTEYSNNKYFELSFKVISLVLFIGVPSLALSFFFFTLFTREKVIGLLISNFKEGRWNDLNSFKGN